MQLVWIVCRHDGRETHYLQDREPGAGVHYALNDQRTAEVTAPSSQVERHHGAAAIHPGRTRLKVFAHAEVADPDRVLIFNGEISSPGSAGDSIEIAAVDQSLRLMSASPAPLKPPGAGSLLQITDEQSEVMWKLIRRSNDRALELQADPRWVDVPGLGIRKGTLANTGVSRTLNAIDGPTTWDQLTDEAGRNRAPDFELKPLDTRGERDDEGAGEIHAEFNTYYPQMGTDRRDEVILEDGHNAEIRHEPTVVDPPLVNRYVLTVASANDRGIAPCIVAENRASMRAFGVREKIESAGGERDLERARKRAEGFVAAHSRHANLFEVTLPVAIGGQARGWAITAEGEILVDQTDSFAIPPTVLPGEHGECWMGDTITVRSKRFNFEVGRGQRGPRTDYPARIVDISFREVDSAGNVGIELLCEGIAEEANAVTSYPSECFTDDPSAQRAVV